MNGVRTWVINLDRAPDRLARIAARLDALGLPWTRFAAVDARRFTPEQKAQLDEAGFMRRHGMTPLPGELGCYLSHVGVLRDFLASSAELALVLEDDVGLPESLPALLESLVNQQTRWDVAKLSAVHSGTPVAVASLGDQHSLAVMLTKCTAASAYLVNRRAARAFLDPTTGLLPMTLPFDHEFDRAWHYGLKLRLVIPVPCVHDDQVPSTIGNSTTSPNRKFKGLKRLPTHLWRLSNEWHRLLYGLREALREKLAG